MLSLVRAPILEALHGRRIFRATSGIRPKPVPHDRVELAREEGQRTHLSGQDRPVVPVLAATSAPDTSEQLPDGRPSLGRLRASVGVETTMLLAVTFIVFNLIVDVFYGILDPRITTE